MPTCINTPGWYGRFGRRFNCGWYSQNNRCARYGGNERFRNFGKTANEACCACGKQASRSARNVRVDIEEEDIEKVESFHSKAKAISDNNMASPTPLAPSNFPESKSPKNDAIVADLAEWLKTDCIKSTSDTALMIEYAIMFHDLGLDSAYAVKDLLDVKALNGFSWMKSFHKRAVEKWLAANKL